MHCATQLLLAARVKVVMVVNQTAVHFTCHQQQIGESDADVLLGRPANERVHSSAQLHHHPAKERQNTRALDRNALCKGPIVM